MGASIQSGSSNGGRRRRRAGRPMSEINVTPMVDVMLVLLIIFMVTAPLLTVGVPIELPKSEAKQLEGDKEPLTITRRSGRKDLPSGDRTSNRRNCAQTHCYRQSRI